MASLKVRSDNAQPKRKIAMGRKLHTRLFMGLCVIEAVVIASLYLKII